MHLARLSLIAAVGLSFLSAAPGHAQEKKPVTKFARFEVDGATAYGVVEGETVRQIKGDIFGKWETTETTYPLAKVKLLVPTRPTQVLAMAGNYRSHLSTPEIPEKLKIPQIFFKSPSCLIADGENIVLPKTTEDVHYEAELVIVIGKTARDVPKEKALEYVFGVTCGNDVSARIWQKNDVQWWRAKGSDTFGPCGPFVVQGVNYDNLLLQLRQNGEVKQKENTKDLIHDISAIVSYASQHVTLHPGDLIYTGCPGKTEAMKAGDVIEVELEGVGVLRNKVVAEK